MTIRVLLVDDHAVVLEGLSMVVDGLDGIDVVAVAGGGSAAASTYVEHRPDVVLMDMSMPEVDGVEATRRIMAADADARVVILTGFIDDALVADAVDAGACGYLLKNVARDDLANAIRTVAAGGSILSDEALRRLSNGRRRRLGDDLTSREADVLRLVVQGLTNQQIADALGLRHGTIRINVSNILAKLHAENRTAAAHLAITEGLVDAGD